jgi:hypothetical protein
MSSLDEVVEIRSDNGTQSTFWSAAIQLEERALRGQLVTRDDLDRLLQHHDLIKLELHCFAVKTTDHKIGNGPLQAHDNHDPISHDEHTDRIKILQNLGNSFIFSATMSLSKLRREQVDEGDSLVRRHRSGNRLRGLFNSILDRAIADCPRIYYTFSPNYILFATSDSSLDPSFTKDLLRQLSSSCEIIRRCSINYQNIRRSSVADSPAVKIAANLKEPSSRGDFLFKTEFVAELGKVFNCSAESFDVDVPKTGRLSETRHVKLIPILEFVSRECASFGINPKPDMESDITRLVQESVGRGLPMALTLGGHEPIVLLLFPFAARRDIIRIKLPPAASKFANRETADLLNAASASALAGAPRSEAWHQTGRDTPGDRLTNSAETRRVADARLRAARRAALEARRAALEPVRRADERRALHFRRLKAKQIICMVKEKQQVTAFDVDSITQAIDTFLSYRYEELRVQALTRLTVAVADAIRNVPEPRYDRILARVVPVLSEAIDALIETTLADRASLWIVNPDPKEMTCWVSGRLKGNTIKQQRIPLSVNPGLDFYPRITEKVSGHRSIVVDVYRTGKLRNLEYAHPRVAGLMIPRVSLNKESRQGSDTEQVWGDEAYEYHSILCVPVFFNQVPMGSLLLESRLQAAFTEDDVRYIEGIKTSLEAMVENIYRRNDFQWLIDRLHSYQAAHALNRLAHTERMRNRLSKQLFQKIQTYLLGLEDFDPQAPGIPASVLYEKVRSRVEERVTGFRRLQCALLRNLRWQLPPEMPISPLVAESISLIVDNFADNILRALPDDTDAKLHDVIKVEHQVNGRDNIPHVEVKCLIYSDIDPVVLNQLGIAPILPQAINSKMGDELKIDHRAKLGLFLVGVLARINGGALEVDRRNVIPPHPTTNKPLPRVIRAILPNTTPRIVP